MAQPAAITVLEGTLYYVTDESIIERSNGTSWESYSGVNSGNSIIQRIPGIDGLDGEAEYPLIIPTKQFNDIQNYCSVFHSTTQSIATGAFVPLNLDSEDFDNSLMHDNVTNNTRITIPVGGAGIYLFVGAVQFDVHATGQRVAIGKKNGTTFIPNATRVPVNSAVSTSLAICGGLIQLQVGDYLEICGFQDSGVNMNVGSSIRFAANSLQMVKLGNLGYI